MHFVLGGAFTTSFCIGLGLPKTTSVKGELPCPKSKPILGLSPR
jgi:hypothetical protein